MEDPINKFCPEELRNLRMILKYALKHGFMFLASEVVEEVEPVVLEVVCFFGSQRFGGGGWTVKGGGIGKVVDERFVSFIKQLRNGQHFQGSAL